MFKKTLIILSFLAAVGARHVVPLYAQTQQSECPPECTIDTMEIVTWYPSPYNEYEELRLYPKVSADESRCDSFDKLGLMYYNKDQQALKVCWQDPANLSYSWKDITLGEGLWQLSGSDISNTNTQGNVVISNALTIGNTNTATSGTIRFTGTDFEGFINGKWVSLTTKTNEFSTSQEFITNGIFVVPTGVTKIKVRAWGGGGGGGYTWPPSGCCQGGGGGGGGGGVFGEAIFSVNPGEQYSISIASGGGLGSNGGSTTFGVNLLVVGGGYGGTQGTCYTGPCTGCVSCGGSSGAGGLGGSNASVGGDGSITYSAAGGSGTAGGYAKNGTGGTASSSSGGVGNGGDGGGGGGKGKVIVFY